MADRVLAGKELMCPLLQDFLDFQGVLAGLVVWLLHDELCYLFL
jgi:hypothetical protein